jgi:hypothetical protein
MVFGQWHWQRVLSACRRIAPISNRFLPGLPAYDGRRLTEIATREPIGLAELVKKILTLPAPNAR